jgi:hypothetical protein
MYISCYLAKEFAFSVLENLSNVYIEGGYRSLPLLKMPFSFYMIFDLICFILS